MDLEKKKHKHGSTVRVKIIIVVVVVVLLLIEFDRQTNKSGFSTVYNELQARLQGRKTRFRR